jgi:TM2 domain-containing membrane protein YozV
MNIDTIMIIVIIIGFLISFISFMIWVLTKNKKVAKFFEKISDWFAEYWRW